jgi:uncharacterized protein
MLIGAWLIRANFATLGPIRLPIVMRPVPKIFLGISLLSLTIGLWAYQSGHFPTNIVSPFPFIVSPLAPEILPVQSPQIQRLLDNAQTQIQQTRSYDPAYVPIAYPGGDVPMATGVCTDVVIRAFRGAGVDLQQQVHEDMRGDFGAYPQEWGLSGPDANIDHRRVPNLMRYFERQGKSLTPSRNAAEYQPGDVVTWDVGGGNWHTGVVSNAKSRLTGQPLIIHNIGGGVQQQDVLFAWQVLGHYRYF